MENSTQSQGFKTREVMVGNVGVGGDNPIRIQSMTTTNTRDVAATTAQIKALVDVGCEIVRVTVQGMKEADACEEIKNELIKSGYTVPIVADIHFYPPASMRVVEFADKVRINPGNFIDKRASFKVIEYDDASYQLELDRLEEKFSPLVEKCKRLNRAIRIGTNHGSLSDRVMNRHGDSPRGMVISAMEFTEVCRKLDFHNIIYSMKASNVKVMTEAYRLLVAELQARGWDYPLHLGVTEAGAGIDGRVKSALGIGSLLLDGIGNTIRVSLTENPKNEIAPCRRIISFAKENTASVKGCVCDRKSSWLHRDGTVAMRVTLDEIEQESFFSDIGCKEHKGQLQRETTSVDAVITSASHPKLEQLKKAGVKVIHEVYTVTDQQETWPALLEARPEVIFFAPERNRVSATRHFFRWLAELRIKTPVMLDFRYEVGIDDLPMHSGAEFGALLVDGLGEGISLRGPMLLELRRSLSFSILQGCRMRLSKTEFISCPGCGRTLFDLESVAANIRKRTEHLPGVKIAIMGCIVNGPGEMADADFGYVGSRPGKIDLYIGKKCVERNIDMDKAEAKLVTLIKQEGRWVEPVSTS